MALPDPIENACFVPSDFQAEDFSVDEFISRCKKRVTTEHLHSDLKSYYDTLKVAMIELINRDYGDFLDLSANLVGMDKQIETIALPLSEVNEEILKIKYTMEKVAIGLKNKMAAREEIRQKKRITMKVIESINSIELLQKLLSRSSSSDDQVDQWEELDRISMEFNKLRHNMSSVSNIALMKTVTPQIEAISGQLHEILNNMLSCSLKSRDSATLLKTLETYSVVGNIAAAEDAFRVAVVEPGLREIVTTKAVLTHGLEEVYKEVLKFIPRHCSFMLEVSNNVAGFDVLINAIWAELVSAICSQASVIFVPGNPEVFHRNFTFSMEFIEKLEAGHCTSTEQVARLRGSMDYAKFINKWSLPVYFQIRFHEIGGRFEGQLERPLKEEETVQNDDREQFTLQVFTILHSCIEQCWSDKVYVPPLVHRFWKLTLQLVARLKSCMCEKLSSSSDQDLGISACLQIAHDVRILQEKIKLLFERTIRPKLLLVVGDDKISSYGDVLQQSCVDLITALIPNIAVYVTESLSQLCIKNLDAVHTIPRLYRRTNREVPAKQSGYVQNILKPLVQIDSKLLGSALSTEWMCNVVGNVTERYYEITSEVLDNVKRTEDSLLKLKRNRRSVQISEQLVPEGMSDDNKIRLQLAIDIDIYVKEVQRLLSTDQVDSLVFLKKLSELAATAKTAAIT